MRVPASTAGRVRRWGVHLLRVGMLACILWMIHRHHAELAARSGPAALDAVELSDVLPLFPEAAGFIEAAPVPGARGIVDADGETLGCVLQTSPECDDIIGFSGPTNVLIALDGENRIRGLRLLRSGDTQEHVAQVQVDPHFLQSFQGLTRSDAAQRTRVDAVSGATLTSLAIAQSVSRRLGGGEVSLRFPQSLSVEDAAQLFPEAAGVVPSEHDRTWCRVLDGVGNELGTILRTSPAADNIVGYQGPTEARIGFDRQGRIVGVAVGPSYDNEPYVTYVREDAWFLELFNGRSLHDLAELDLQAAGVEGVSGATMTSLAVAEGLVEAARRRVEKQAVEEQPTPAAVAWTAHDLGTAGVIAAGLLLGLTRLRSMRLLRIGFQLVLIGYLGLTTGNLLSLALIGGWSRHGVPWRTAGGLALLTLAAFLVPITAGRNVYCSHLCPHGAVQQLVKRRLPWQWSVPRSLVRVLAIIPAALLLLSLTALLGWVPLSLVDIEPFDAWVPRIAGWATLTIAVVGLVASLFVPMAYCRYGCPTGALLQHVRLHGRSGQWSGRDWLALGALALVAAMRWAPP